MSSDMKKVLSTALTTISLLGLSATTAFATTGGKVDPCSTGGGNSGMGQFKTLCTLNANNLGQIVGTLVTFILIIAVLIALFFLIFGGIRWITSGGDKAKVESARGTIIAAIVGFVIAFLAFFILSLALSFFGLSLNNLTLPRLGP